MIEDIKTLKEEINIGGDRFAPLREENLKIIDSDIDLQKAIAYFKKSDLQTYQTIVYFLSLHLLTPTQVAQIKERSENLILTYDSSVEYLSEVCSKFNIPENPITHPPSNA